MMRRAIAGVLLAGVLVTGAPAADGGRPQAAAPCMYEDGSGQARCVWDARHRGNGIGRSFVVRRVFGYETFVYVSHTRAHALVAAHQSR